MEEKRGRLVSEKEMKGYERNWPAFLFVCCWSGVGCNFNHAKRALFFFREK